MNFGEYVSPTKGWSRPLCETICGYVSKTRCLATLLMYTYIYISSCVYTHKYMSVFVEVVLIRQHLHVLKRQFVVNLV